MKEYSIEELIEASVTKFHTKVHFKEEFFTNGTETEILTKEGKDAIAESIQIALENDLETAKMDAREILVKKSIINKILDTLGFDDSTLMEQKNKLELDYANASKKVRKLEGYLANYKLYVR